MWLSASANLFFHLWNDINWHVLVYFVFILFTNEDIEETESYELQFIKTDEGMAVFVSM